MDEGSEFDFLPKFGTDYFSIAFVICDKNKSYYPLFYKLKFDDIYIFIFLYRSKIF